MIAATPGRRRRLTALRSVLAIVAMVVFVGLGVPAHAQTLVAPTPLRVTLTGATASGTTRSDTVVLTGTVTNDGTAPLTTAQARLWRSNLMLRTHLALDEGRRGEVPAGRTMPDPAVVSGGTGPGVVAPGETVAFELRSTLGDLNLVTAGATYWVGAIVTADGPGRVEGSARTWLTLPGTDAVPVTSVVELSARPRLVRPNLFVDDTLADELTGRLGVLLDAAAEPGVSRVVDPALVAEVADMADGYRVVEGVESRAGTRSDVARAWLAELQALPASSGHPSLLGRPDLAGARAAGGRPLVDRLVAAGGDRQPGTVVTLDHVDAGTLAAVSGLGAPVLASGTGLPVPWARVDGVGVLNAVGPDTRVDAAALPDTPLNRALTLAAYARADGGQVRLLRTEADVFADRAALPTWATRRLLADVVATPPQEGQFTLDDRRTPTVLASGDAAALADLGDGLAAYAGAAPSSGVGSVVGAQLARAASQAWAGASGERATWLAAIDARMGAAALREGIRLSALPRFTMTADTNEFPMTVSNSLPDDIVLRLVGTSDTPQRIRLEPSEPVIVRAGTSTGVMLRAVATGNGVADARIHAETGAGQRLTPDIGVVVEATNLGTVAWAIVAVSGAVLVVSTALRIRQVRARQAGGGHAH